MARHERPLMRYAARITGDVERARDVVQDTFMRLLSAERSPGDNHLAQWLFTVCRNRALDVVRKERRMTTLSEARAEAQTYDGPTPPAVVQRRESVGRLQEALVQLPARQQEAVRLKFQDGFTYRQIAAVMGLSHSNVGFLIHTALKTIRSKLGSGPGDAGTTHGEQP